MKQNVTQKSNVNTKSNSSQSTKKEVTFKKELKNIQKVMEISCDKHETTPMNWSDYLIDFADEVDETFKNVTDIKLTNIDICMIPHIDETCNTLEINGMELELDDGDYTINEIMELFNETMESAELNITVTNIDGKITIESTNEEEFEMNCEGNSIAKYLGFVGQKYSEQSKYVAEIGNAFHENGIYLYLKNISSDQPFAVINSDGSFEQKITSFGNGIPELSCLIVQFKTDITSDDDNFANLLAAPHRLTFTFSASSE